MSNANRSKFLRIDLFICGKERRSISPHWPPSGNEKSFFQEQCDKVNTGTYELEVSEFKSEVTFDLQGHLGATMASEATEVTVRGNMHMDTMVIKVADFKSEVKFDL